MYKCCELQRIVAILLQFYYKLRNQLNTFISYDKLKIVISKKLNTRNIANYNLKLKKRKVLWNAKPYNPWRTIYIYISTILQNKEKQFNLINKIRVGANSTLLVVYKNKKENVLLEN